jgi:hypothetical protein
MGSGRWANAGGGSGECGTHSPPLEGAQEKCRATYGSTKIGEDGKVTMEEHFGPCLRSMRSYIAERALR